MATPSIIHKSGGGGWIFILFTLVCMYGLRKKDMRTTFLSLLFLLIVPAVYWTGATFLLLLMSVSFLFAVFFKQNYKLSTNMVILYIAMWFAYCVYISVSRFSGLIETITAMPKIFWEAFLGTTPHIEGSELAQYYIASTSIENKIRIGIASFLGLTPILYFLFEGYKNFKREQMAKVLFAFILSVGLFAFFYALSGLSGYGRLPEYGGIASILIFSCLVGSNLIKKKHRIILISLAFLIIFSSCYAYVNDENSIITHLTHKESQGVEWIIFEIEDEKAIFTDQRIGGCIAAHGHSRVTGIYGEKTSEVIQNLCEIYYDNDPAVAETALSNITLLNGQHMDYLFFSSQMSANLPGIAVTGVVYRGAPENFLIKYNLADFADLIYQNDEVNIYVLKINP